jgi:hypothetical protein
MARKPKPFAFLTKAQYDRLPQAEKIAYLDRAIAAWQKLEARGVSRTPEDFRPDPE